MALNVKLSNSMSAMDKLGVDPKLIEWVKGNPVKITLTPKGFTISHPTPDGEQGHFVPMTVGQMQQLSLGTLASATQNGIKVQLELTLYGIEEEHSDFFATLPASDVAAAQSVNTTKKVSALSKLPPQKLSAETEKVLAAVGETVEKKSGKWYPFPEDKMKTAPLVKLRDANQMYQPVLGTSAGSRYYLVAANSDIRVAARLIQQRLSIRVEGPKLQNYITAVSNAGLTYHTGKEYASAHFETDQEPGLANKTLGAVLMGLGITLETPFPQLQRIANK